MNTGFEGLDPLQEGEEVMPHARGGLVPILSGDAESIRKGGRIKQQQGAHDAVSSDLVSLFLSQNAWHGSRKMSNASYPVIRYAATRHESHAPGLFFLGRQNELE